MSLKVGLLPSRDPENPVNLLGDREYLFKCIISRVYCIFSCCCFICCNHHSISTRISIYVKGVSDLVIHIQLIEWTAWTKWYKKTWCTSRFTRCFSCELKDNLLIYNLIFWLIKMINNLSNYPSSVQEYKIQLWNDEENCDKTQSYETCNAFFEILCNNH